MLLECENLTMAYEGETVIKNIGFSVDSGDILFITGENGAGKSTLIKGLLGIVRPVAGKVKYVGLKRSDIGYLSQRTPAENDFPAGVREIVMSAFARERPLLGYSEAQKSTAAEFMKALGIEKLCDRPFNGLSGGQRQRVLLARAMCAAKKMLLLDEPVSGLDPVIADCFYECVAYGSRNRGGCAVMSSHDIENAKKYATHILHIKNDGFYFGTSADYFGTRSESGR